MKITKKAIKASDVITDANVVPVPNVDTSCCKYQCAIDSISLAIESLAEIAKDDQVAKDSIANLGVVLLDLKGTCQ